MKAYSFSLALRLVVLVGVVQVVLGLGFGQVPFALSGGVIAYLAWRLGDLMIASKRLADVTQDLITGNQTLMAERAELLEMIRQQQSDINKLAAHNAAVREAHADYVERASSIIGKARMIIAGRK